MVGGSLGFIFGYLVGGHTAGVHPGKGVYASSALALEIMLSAALALVVLNVAASKATSGNSFYGLAIGFTVAAGAFTIGPLSGGAFNPAVGFGATLASGIFASGSWADLWIYILGPLIGAAIAAGIHYFQIGREEPPKQVVTALGPASDSVP